MERLIFIEVLGMPDLSKSQHSCSNRESAFLSSRVMSGLMIMPLGKEDLFDRTDMASKYRLNLTRMDRGLVALSLNFPSLKQSRILCL